MPADLGCAGLSGEAKESDGTLEGSIAFMLKLKMLLAEHCTVVCRLCLDFRLKTEATDALSLVT